MANGPPLDRTLDPAAFYSLYRGALAAESVERRIKRSYAVVLAGRLGLRPGEILHCHEGWVDWGRGEIRVPALEPCACEACWARARGRQARGDERPLDEILADEQWSPGTESGARTVAFGWSERISGLLATVFDYVEVLCCDRVELAAFVREAAADAEGIDPEGLTPQVLRATGGRFLADAGFDATSVRHLLGLDDRERAEAFVRASGQRTSAGIFRVFDREAVAPDVPPANPERKFPIVCDPAPFGREPFDPADFDRAGRLDRATDDSGRRVRNPRPTAVPGDVDYDPDAHRLAGQADAEGGQFSETAGADAPDVAALRDWITRRDASLRAESELGRGTGVVAPGMADDDGDPVDPGEGPPSEPEPLSAGANEAGVAADGATVRPGPDALAGRRGPSLGSGEPETVAEAVTEPVVASVGTRVVAPGLGGGGPVEGRVVLGQDELLLATPGSAERLDADDVAFTLVPLDAVVDVVPDAGTDGTPFESTLGVARRTPGGRELAVLELGGQRRRDFRMALFRNALHVSQMQVTHPARVGGRVTDESPTPGMLYLDRERVRFTTLGSDATLVEIDLDEILRVERTRQDVAGDRQPALAIQQFVDGDERPASGDRNSDISDDGEAVTSLVGSSSARTLALFERFVRRDYRERLERARSLSIPDREKEVLVALYSIGESVDLTSVFNRDADALRDIVASLASKDLVDGESLAETGLTARGRLVVGDRLEAVND